MPTNNLSVPGIVGIAILVILVLVIIVRNIYVVQQSRAYVVERLGAFRTVWNVGLHLKVPFIERVAKKVSLKEQVADFDPIDLYNARQAIRSEMEQDAVHKLQERYTDEYSYITMVDGRREVSLMLDEYAEEQRIQQLKQEQQRKFQQERRQNHPLKKQKDRER